MQRKGNLNSPWWECELKNTQKYDFEKHYGIPLKKKEEEHY